MQLECPLGQNPAFSEGVELQIDVHSRSVANCAGFWVELKTWDGLKRGHLQFFSTN